MFLIGNDENPNSQYIFTKRCLDSTKLKEARDPQM